jgi:hypothetical protein
MSIISNPILFGTAGVFLSSRCQTRVSELKPTAGVNGGMTLPYLILSKTIAVNSSGRYKIETRKSCRARDTVICRAN